MNTPRIEALVAKRGKIRDHSLHRLARNIENDHGRLRALLAEYLAFPSIDGNPGRARLRTMLAAELPEASTAQKAVEVVIHVEGGLVQGVVASQPVAFIVADTDTDGVEDLVELPASMQRRLGSAAASRSSSMSADVDPQFVVAAINLLGRRG